MTEPIDDRKETARTARGTFATGNPGGPGRPPGRGPAAEMRAMLATDLDKIISVVRAQALAGDMQAARIIIDRLHPTLRAVDLPAMLDMPADGTLAEQARAVVQAAAAGDLAPAQAAQIVSALGGVVKIIETTELLQRIEALEAQSKAKGKT